MWFLEVMDFSIPTFVFALLAYWIPEALAIIVQLFVIIHDLGVANATAEFTKRLYDEMSDTDEYRVNVNHSLNNFSEPPEDFY